MSNSISRPHLLISDFDQTLSFHYSGLVLGEILGIRDLRERIEGLSKIHLVQQGGELSYLLLHDPDLRRVRKEHLIETGKRSRVTVTCSEADPLDCHRCLLVGRALAEAGIDVAHLLASGDIITHTEAEDRLLQLEHLAEDLLIPSREKRLAEAYRARARKAAYAMPQASSGRRAAGRRD